MKLNNFIYMPTVKNMAVVQNSEAVAGKFNIESVLLKIMCRNWITELYNY
jgi:hypothetical protein